MQEARRTSRPTASGKVILAQEGQGTSPGFLIYMPVFTTGENGRELRGFIYSPFNAVDFLASQVGRDGSNLEPVIRRFGVRPRFLEMSLAGLDRVLLRQPVVLDDLLLEVDALLLDGVDLRLVLAAGQASRMCSAPLEATYR